ncbi:MAG: PH domain-containing protein [Sporichthyaceae bacterium]
MGRLGAPARRPAGSSLVAKYLLPAERVIVSLRLHWFALRIPLAVAGGGLVLALLLDIALPASAALGRDVVWLAWAATLWYFGWHYVNWWSDRFVVTDKRVMWVHGLVNRNADMMPLSKVTDMRYERTVAGRMFGYGSFIMESAGQDQALSRIDHIVEPDWLYREICAQLFTPEAVSANSGGERRGRDWPGYGPDDPDPACSGASHR